VSIDKANQVSYQENFNAFSEKWKAAITVWESKASTLKGTKAVIQHKNLSYLFNWLGIEIFADLEPKAGLPPTSGHLTKVLGDIQNNRPDYVAIASYQSHKGAHWLEKRAKLPIVVLPFTVGGDKKSDTLYSLYENTIDLLLGAIDHDG